MNTKQTTIDLDTTHLRRLEVDGRFVGWLDIWAGLVTLYLRGKWAVYNIAEERERAQVAQGEKA